MHQSWSAGLLVLSACANRPTFPGLAPQGGHLRVNRNSNTDQRSLKPANRGRIQAARPRTQGSAHRAVLPVPIHAPPPNAPTLTPVGLVARRTMKNWVRSAQAGRAFFLCLRNELFSAAHDPAPTDALLGSTSAAPGVTLPRRGRPLRAHRFESDCVGQGLKATAADPPIAGAAHPTLRADVGVAHQVAQRRGIAQFGLPRGKQNGVELAIGYLSAGLAEIFGFAADRDVVRIQSHVHATLRRDRRPQIAWFEYAVAPGAVAGIDIAIQRAVQSHGVVGGPLGRAVQKLRDCPRFSASLRVQHKRDRWTVWSTKPAVATSPAANGSSYRFER
jgi:hypothetical protein